MKSIATIRREYSLYQLTMESMHPNPIVQFKKWMEEAIKAELLEPSAATLSTASKKGIPSSRIVLLKGIEKEEFIFYTNYQSQKGRELQENPACALNFFWPDIERQVSIKGIAAYVDATISDAYFSSRPRSSQLGAWASPQSAMIKNRKILEERLAEIEKRYAGSKSIPRPKQWGGYRIAPYEIEFWQGRPGRLHDRMLYSLKDEWVIHRLAP